MTLLMPINYHVSDCYYTVCIPALITGTAIMAVDSGLYGSEHSLFTGKARAYLRYKGLNWEERAATRERYRNAVLPRCVARH